MSTFSNLLRIEKQSPGANQGTWGAPLNESFERIEDAIAGVAVIDTQGGTVTLSTNDGTTDQARMAALRIQGTLLQNLIIEVPDLPKEYLISNETAGAFTLTVRNRTAGNAIEVAQGFVVRIWSTGSDCYLASPPVNRTTTASVALDAYPVGSVYFSVIATSPAILFGGTWQQISQGRVPIGVGTGTDANSVQRTFANGATGGEYDHTLTVSEMPRHNHTGNTDQRGGHRHDYGDFTRQNNQDYQAGATSGNVGERELSRQTGEAGAHSHGLSISHTGDDQPHNNLPPWFALYIWQRTA